MNHVPLERVATALVVSVLLAASACTGSDDDAAHTTTSASTDAAAYTEKIERSLRAETDQISDEESGCLAARLIRILDPQRLAEQGVEPEDLAADGTLGLPALELTQEQLNAVYESYGECGIDLRAVFLERTLGGSVFNDEEKACLDSVITDDDVRALMMAPTTPGEGEIDRDPEVDAFSDEILACINDN